MTFSRNVSVGVAVYGAALASGAVEDQLRHLRPCRRYPGRPADARARVRAPAGGRARGYRRGSPSRICCHLRAAVEAVPVQPQRRPPASSRCRSGRGTSRCPRCLARHAGRRPRARQPATTRIASTSGDGAPQQRMGGGEPVPGGQVELALGHPGRARVARDDVAERRVDEEERDARPGSASSAHSASVSGASGSWRTRSGTVRYRPPGRVNSSAQAVQAQAIERCCRSTRCGCALAEPLAAQLAPLVRQAGACCRGGAAKRRSPVPRR